MQNSIIIKGAKEHNLKDINIEIQEFINEIVFLRICEDRNLPLYKTLQNLFQLIQCFKKNWRKLLK